LRGDLRGDLRRDIAGVEDARNIVATSTCLRERCGMLTRFDRVSVRGSAPVGVLRSPVVWPLS
jgi:hypothetical protein